LFTKQQQQQQQQQQQASKQASKQQQQQQQQQNREQRHLFEPKPQNPKTPKPQTPKPQFIEYLIFLNTLYSFWKTAKYFMACQHHDSFLNAVASFQWEYHDYLKIFKSSD